jgi:uncharacterized membrane protein
MSRQDIYLFIHIAAAVIWVGGGSLITLMGHRAIAAADRDRTRVVVQEAAWLGQRLFIPASVVVLAMGILLVADGPWEFDLWVALGLAGYVATAVTGAAVLGPRSERIAHMIEEAGGTYTDAADVESRKLLTLARIDSVVLFLVIADMALKPSGDDVGLLAVMALILVGGVAYSISRYRAIGAETPATAVPA